STTGRHGMGIRIGLGDRTDRARARGRRTGKTPSPTERHGQGHQRWRTSDMEHPVDRVVAPERTRGRTEKPEIRALHYRGSGRTFTLRNLLVPSSEKGLPCSSKPHPRSPPTWPLSPTPGRGKLPPAPRASCRSS